MHGLYFQHIEPDEMFPLELNLSQDIRVGIRKKILFQKKIMSNVVCEQWVQYEHKQVPQILWFEEQWKIYELLYKTLFFSCLLV